jgi:hypothetical protein
MEFSLVLEHVAWRDPVELATLSQTGRQHCLQVCRIHCEGLRADPLRTTRLLSLSFRREANLQADMYWVQFPPALAQVNNKREYPLKTESYKGTSFEENF